MTLLWKEWRDLFPRFAVAIGMLLVGMLALAGVNGVGLVEQLHRVLAREGWAMFVRDYGLTRQLHGYAMGIWVSVLAYDALAGDLSDNTWRFLRTRPASTRALIAAKLGLRLALWLVPWLAYRAAVLAVLVWGTPGPTDFTVTAARQADAWYAWTSPPYPFVYVEVWTIAQLLIVFAVATMVGAFVQPRGLAFAAQFAANVLLWAVVYWLFAGDMIAILGSWQAGGAPFYAMCAASVVLSAGTVWYVATARPRPFSP